MADISIAIVGLLGVVAGGYFNNFLAEDYKRFRDSQALAGALAGELEAHGEAIPLLQKSLPILSDMAGRGLQLNMPESEKPNSPIFEENAGKIGALGPELAREVAYVYENINAFRAGMHQVSKVHKDMEPHWNHAMLKGCLERIEGAQARGEPLIGLLKAHAKASYWWRLATIKQIVFATVLFVGFLVAMMVFSQRSQENTNCTTVFDHAKGVLTTICK
ncbi:hypothetical protein [Paraburkholderia hospita]|uniref:Uncharacterized protein n=1 Tax=Paraburkholderia hospita TaxID=169430 RepID=A0AAN1JH72_9BURK|nr:hypothetical protein [Paraburkholderia hospita]AUT74039.1 hypothetical protein C2L64_37720 [Paraburkholderia hospita]EIN02949.1 hypothetical protein WQE_00965 [Paraburkholderia hospita]OUL78691.1 hypothetical protein CA602_31095 [Paraburkholderia hospita]OUL85896.1 hypothetical protein CA601_23090 [Paraburkholderia hospita]SEH45509.1 hypothetical protein SAMN05192544_100246 [Paraburkholderia hospita]